MAVILSTVRKYVPEFGSNHKKPEGEQITVYLKNVDIHRRQKQLRKFMNTDPKKLMDMMMEEKQSNEIQDILKENVVRFENLKIDEGQVDETTGAPKLRDATMQDIISMGEWMLCIELFMNILNSSQIAPDLEKNLKSQSGSTPQSALVEGEVVAETAH